MQVCVYLKKPQDKVNTSISTSSVKAVVLLLISKSEFSRFKKGLAFHNPENRNSFLMRVS